jgi:hypothetical protein
MSADTVGRVAGLALLVLGGCAPKMGLPYGSKVWVGDHYSAEAFKEREAKRV